MEGPPDKLPEALPDEPMSMASEWLAHAWKVRPQPNPHAIVLATVNSNGHPSSRVVLCKEIHVELGYLVFYTNYRSRKGRELAGNDRASAVLFWDALHRQIRVEGRVVKSPPEESDAYFATRSWDKQLGAWCSEQSQPIESRTAMQAKVMDTARKLSLVDAGGELSGEARRSPIPRPPHWGGYRLWADAVEIWTEGEGRVHDRGLWTRTLSEPLEDSPRV